MMSFSSASEKTNTTYYAKHKRLYLEDLLFVTKGSVRESIWLEDMNQLLEVIAEKTKRRIFCSETSFSPK